MCNTGFNIKEFYILPTKDMYVFGMFSKKLRLFPHTALTEKF
jgi:hypothetical protein